MRSEHGVGRLTTKEENMGTLSRRNFIKIAGAGLFSAASLGLVGCGGSSSGSGDAAASGEAWGEGATLRVGSDCDYAPHSWVQTDDSNGAIALSDGSGYVGGYDTKIAQMIGDKYGWTVTFIKVDWDGLIPALNAGKIDCTIDGMGVTEERKQSVDFSNYYWSSDQGMLLLADSPFAKGTSLADFGGAKVAAQIGSMWEAMVDQIPGVDKKESLPDVNTIITALKSGKIDATIMGETEAKSCMKSNPELAYVTFEEGKGFEVDLSDCSAGIAVAKGNTELLDKINAVVDTIDRDMQEKLMDEAFAEQPLSVG